MARTEGHERVSFPSAALRGRGRLAPRRLGLPAVRGLPGGGAGGRRRGRRERRPGPLEAVERFGRCATRELEELSGNPRPLLEAELWALARDWKLKPVTIAGGTMWELP